MPKPTGPTNLVTKNLIMKFGKKKEHFFKKLAKELGRSSRSKKGVNVGKIEKTASKGEDVAVPGKVLSAGSITKSVNVYALSFSKTAKQKITNAGGSCHGLDELKEKARIII